MGEMLDNARHEQFAQCLARGERQGASYRKIYGTAGGCDSVAHDLAKLPEIMARVAELKLIAADRTAFTVADALQRWIDIAAADPRELIETLVSACRFCHGEQHGYQWKEREYLAACAAAERDDEPLPDPLGGFGFRFTADPHPDCPECEGRGQRRIEVKDTSKMSASALLLYEGVKQTRDGIEIKMKDRTKALENACRIIGAFNDKLDIGDPLGKLFEKVANLAALAPDEAARRYQETVAQSLH